MQLEELLKQIKPTPYHVAYYKAPGGDMHLAVWDDAVQNGERGQPICLVAPNSNTTNQDEAHARYLVHAANQLPKLVKALKLARATLEDYKFDTAAAAIEPIEYCGPQLERASDGTQDLGDLLTDAINEAQSTPQ
jgi:hypothetical protein